MDILTWYEYYLFLVVIVSIALRYHLLRDILLLARKFPERWPKLLQMLLEHKWSLINKVTIIPVSIAIVMALLHTVCNRWLWMASELKISELSYHPMLCIPLIVFSGWMLFLDIQVLSRATQFKKDELEQLLDRGEFALSTPVDWTVRLFTLGLISPTRVVEHKLEEALELECDQIVTQMRGWYLRTAVRVLFGTCCWITSAYLLI